MSNALSGFIQVFFVLAIWYIPSAINKPSAAELSTGKAKALGVIAVIVIGIYIIALIAAGGSSSGNDMNGWDDYDHDHNGVIDDNEFADGWKDYIEDFLG